MRHDRFAVVLWGCATGFREVQGHRACVVRLGDAQGYQLESPNVISRRMERPIRITR